jgi:hypothetical protein
MGDLHTPEYLWLGQSSMGKEIQILRDSEGQQWARTCRYSTQIQEISPTGSREKTLAWKFKETDDALHQLKD